LTIHLRLAKKLDSPAISTPFNRTIWLSSRHPPILPLLVSTIVHETLHIVLFRKISADAGVQLDDLCRIVGSADLCKPVGRGSEREKNALFRLAEIQPQLIKPAIGRADVDRVEKLVDKILDSIKEFMRKHPGTTFDDVVTALFLSLCVIFHVKRKVTERIVSEIRARLRRMVRGDERVK